MDENVRITRRGLLRTGLIGSAVIWAGGRIGYAAGATTSPSADTGTRRAALTPTGEEILRAVIPAVLGSLLPTDAAGREEALEVGLTSLDDYLAYLPLPLQDEARDAFETLDLLPVRLLLLGTWGRWSEASPAMVQAFLESVRQSRFDLLRRVFAFLHSMAVLSWFDQREAWPAIGYPGPPIELALPKGGVA